MCFRKMEEESGRAASKTHEGLQNIRRGDVVPELLPGWLVVESLEFSVRQLMFHRDRPRTAKVSSLIQTLALEFKPAWPRRRQQEEATAESSILSHYEDLKRRTHAFSADWFQFGVFRIPVWMPLSAFSLEVGDDGQPERGAGKLPDDTNHRVSVVTFRTTRDCADGVGLRPVGSTAGCSSTFTGTLTEALQELQRASKLRKGVIAAAGQDHRLVGRDGRYNLAKRRGALLADFLQHLKVVEQH
jgi:hypothetical protein